MTDWKCKYDMRSLLDKDIPPEVKAHSIAEMLKSHKCFADIDEETIQYFESWHPDYDDIENFDWYLEDVYDYADANKIWLSSGRVVPVVARKVTNG